MAEIVPFRALRYNPAKVGDLERVVTQPYDKITAEMQERYYGLNPYNLVRIIRGRQTVQDTPQDNVYTRAARAFRDWIEEGVLTPDPAPALYPYHQEYTVPGPSPVKRQRRGFIALCRLQDYSAGVVHRHEETLSAPKADRLELLKVTRAHFGQIFLLYSDPAGAIERALEPATQGEPLEAVRDEYGSIHSVWRLAAAAAIGPLVEAMQDKKLVIADGHHRYETALAYRNYCRAQGSNDARAEYVMATFIRKESEGLTILPTHRVVHSLGGFDWTGFAHAAQRWFEWEQVKVQGPVADWAGSFLTRLAAAGRQSPTLGVYAGPGNLGLLRLRKDLDLASRLPDVSHSLRRLDVVILHRLLLAEILGIDREAVREERNLRYVRQFDAAIGQVENGHAQLSFLMNPTPVDVVWQNALAGQPLPQKSTDFYPKLLSGLTICWLDGPDAPEGRSMSADAVDDQGRRS
jgi:uncharacterized protein (DUF1015 family)